MGRLRSLRIPARVVLTATLALLVLGLLVVRVDSAPVCESRITTRALYMAAQAYRDGAHGGQCKAFVNRIFNTVARRSGSDARIGWSYYSDYRAVGAMEVASDMVEPGDVIQLNQPGHPDRYVKGMHTAVVLSNLGSGWYLVIDSNWRDDERVHRHVWKPGRDAAADGLVVRYWRLGTTRTGD